MNSLQCFSQSGRQSLRARSLRWWLSQHPAARQPHTPTSPSYGPATPNRQRPGSAAGLQSMSSTARRSDSTINAGLSQQDRRRNSQCITQERKNVLGTLKKKKKKTHLINLTCHNVPINIFFKRSEFGFIFLCYCVMC